MDPSGGLRLRGDEISALAHLKLELELELGCCLCITRLQSCGSGAL